MLVFDIKGSITRDSGDLKHFQLVQIKSFYASKLVFLSAIINTVSENAHSITHVGPIKWDKVVKNGPSKICGR